MELQQYRKCIDIVITKKSEQKQDLKRVLALMRIVASLSLK
jgi:hypothetical protein